MESSEAPQDAQKIIEEQKEQLQQAGLHGKALLERISFLEEQLNDIHMNHAKELEVLEQDKYALERKIEVMTQTHRDMEANNAEDKKSYQRDLEAIKEQEQLSVKAEIGSLKQRLSDTEHELQQIKLKNSQLLENREANEIVIKDLRTEIRNTKTNDTTVSGELSEVTLECLNLKKIIDQSDAEILRLTQELQQNLLQIENLKRTERELRQDKNDAEKDSMNYFKRLEQTREEMQDLRLEIELLQAGGHKSQGNSLFAEVEDKRVEAEKRLIRMNVKFRQLSAKVDQQSKYIYSLKMQIATLLHTRATACDKERLQELGRALHDAREESEMRMRQLLELQEKQKHLQEDRPPPDVGDGDPMVQFYKDKVEHERSDHESTKARLNRSELLLIMESRKVDNLLTKLHEKQREVDVGKADNFKKQAEIDRLKIIAGEPIEVKRQSKDSDMVPVVEKISKNKDNQSEEGKKKNIQSGHHKDSQPNESKINSNQSVDKIKHINQSELKKENQPSEARKGVTTNKTMPKNEAECKQM